jgi:hypothetical protein
LHLLLVIPSRVATEGIDQFVEMFRVLVGLALSAEWPVGLENGLPAISMPSRAFYIMLPISS